MNSLGFKFFVAGAIITLLTTLWVNNQAEQENFNISQAVEHQNNTENMSALNDLSAFQEAFELARQEIRTANTELSDLRAQLAALKTQHKTLKTTVLSQTDRHQLGVEQQASQPVEEQSLTVGAEPANAQTSRVDDTALQADRLAKMDDSLYLQEPDPVWEKDATEQIVNNLSAAGYDDAQLEEVVCRGVLCRIEINQDLETAVADLFEGEQEIIPWSHKGRVETIENASGNPITVMYVTRENHSFPSNF